MKVEVDEDYGFILKEVYGGFTLQTAEGNKLSICMRDDTFEINMYKKDSTNNDNWHRLDYEDFTINKM
jgi:hypothetical protein